MFCTAAAVADLEAGGGDELKECDLGGTRTPIDTCRYGIEEIPSELKEQLRTLPSRRYDIPVHSNNKPPSPLALP